MASHAPQDAGPDLTQGVPLSAFADGPLLKGHVGTEEVLLARVGGEVMAVGASCTHYGGPLAEGVVVEDTVRCPWHHACFSLRTGEALGAPAFDALSCWKVERDGDKIVVREKAEAPPPAAAPSGQPQNVVIVGGGAAGFACAEMLRRHGYQGSLTMLSDDADPPCDRPNLSKDYLAGKAPEEWIPLRPPDFYAENRIGLHLRAAVARIDVEAREVVTRDGRAFSFDRLLLATGAEPVRLPIPGSEREHVLTLRSLADSRRLIERAKAAKAAVVLGSGFIGLEVAAALRERGLDVNVVSRDQRPLETVLGRELGDFISALHEQHGVVFHMGTSIARIEADKVMLDNGRELTADLVVVGVGVRPRVTLAQEAGLAVDGGIVVNEMLETAVPGIFAAGDVARWHDAASGQMRRIEHWVVAERQGQAVARNMLGAARPFRDVPFFWSAHYDVSLRYVGHAQKWDAIEIDGDIAAQDCMVRYRKDGRTVAAAAIGRDRQALECALALERT